MGSKKQMRLNSRLPNGYDIDRWVEGDGNVYSYVTKSGKLRAYAYMEKVGNALVQKGFLQPIGCWEATDSYMDKHTTLIQYLS